MNKSVSAVQSSVFLGSNTNFRASHLSDGQTANIKVRSNSHK